MSILKGNYIKIVPSSDGKREYTVKYFSNSGLYSCTCPSYRFQKTPPSDRVCKHISELSGKDITNRNTSKKKNVYKDKFKNPMSFGTLMDEDEPDVSWFVSIKLNGFYVRIIKGKVYTKTGRLLENVPESISGGFDKKYIFEGEVYPLDMSTNIEERVQLVSRALFGDWDPKVGIFIHDVIVLNKTFKKRYELLLDLEQKKGVTNVVEQYQLKSLPLFEKLKSQVVIKREEGLVLRDPNGMYTYSKRNKNTLKWKPWFKETVHIHDNLCLKKKNSCTYIIMHEGHEYKVSVNNKYKKGKSSRMTIKYSGTNGNGSHEMVRFVSWM